MTPRTSRLGSYGGAVPACIPVSPVLYTVEVGKIKRMRAKQIATKAFLLIPAPTQDGNRISDIVRLIVYTRSAFSLGTTTPKYPLRLGQERWRYLATRLLLNHIGNINLG